MSLRTKFYDAISGNSSKYLPFDFEFCPSLVEEFKKRTGSQQYHEYYKMPVRKCRVEYIGGTGKFHKYYDTLENIRINPFGIGIKAGTLAHFNQKIHPMKGFTRLSDFQEYPYPDPVKDFYWDSISKEAEAIKEKDLISYANMSQTIFEMAWQMRGMEELMMDMVQEPELAHYHLGRITEIRCEFARRYAHAGFDILAVGDDVASQLGMMMSVAMWREYLKPGLARVIHEAKKINPDMYIFYHGCGNLQAIIPELIEIGVNILNPVQPECMDPLEIKRRFGHSLAFWGMLGTQTVMPFGTPEEVRSVCRELIVNAGKEGKLVLAPSHVLEPEVPWDNILAYIETIREYNGE